MKKTMKRETAWGCLAFLAGMLVWGVWEPNAMTAAQTVVMPVFGFVGLAFGMDAYSKQMMGDEQ